MVKKEIKVAEATTYTCSSACQAILTTLSSYASTFLSFFSTIALIFLLSGLSIFGIWYVGSVYIEHQPEIFHAVDTAWCESQPIRSTLLEIIEQLANIYDRLICVWNFVQLFFKTIIRIVIHVALTCDGWSETIREIGLLLRYLAQSIVNWLLDPANNSFDFATVWTQFGNVLTAFEGIIECSCNDIVDIVSFFFDWLRDPYLTCALNNTVNIAVEFIQVFLNFILTQNTISFDDFWDTVCDAILCYGTWLDDIILSIIGLFTSSSPPNFKIFCVISNVICSAIELVKLLFDIAFGAIFGDINSIIGDACTGCHEVNSTCILDPFLNSLRATANCVQDMFGVIDVCLGQSVANLLRFGIDIIQFVQDTIVCLFNIEDVGDFFSTIDLSPLTISLNNLLGYTQRADTHITITGNDCGGGILNSTNFPSPACSRTRTQTSLTCLIAKVLGNGVCAREFADLVNDLADVILLVPNFFVEAISEAPDISDNPLGTDDFETYIIDLLTLISQTFLLIFDQFGHLLQCSDLLEPLGSAVVSIVAAVDYLLDNLFELLVIVLELIAQFFILLLSLFGEDPFDLGFSSELGLFLQILFQVLSTTVDIIGELIKGLINYLIWPSFPEIFDQDAVDCDPPCTPGNGTFVNCFIEPGDCICGLTYQLALSVTFFGINLSNYWPDCGDFNPPNRIVRREFDDTTTSDALRSVIINNMTKQVVLGQTVFEWYDEHFSNSLCGPVFHNWKDGPPPSFSDLEGFAYLACIRYVNSSLHFANDVGSDNPEAFLDLQRIGQIINQGTNASIGLLEYSTMNLLIYLTNPDAILGTDSTNSTKYINLVTALDAHKVSDPFVLKSIFNVRDSAFNIYSRFTTWKQSLNFTKNSVPAHTVSLWDKSVKFGTTFLGTTGKVLKTIWQRDLLSQSTFGIKQTISNLHKNLPSRNSWMTYPTEWRKRAISSWQKPVISPTTILQHRAKFISNAISTVLNMLMSPELSVISPQDHIPYSCTRISFGCTENATNCSSSSLYENLPVNCYDFTSFGLGYAKTNCGNQTGVINFFSDDHCTLFTDELSGAFNSTCGFGTTNTSDWLCISSCERCPTDQVISGFNCSAFDEVIHEMEYNFKRCLGLLEDLPVLTIPGLPTQNFLTFTAPTQPTDPPAQTRQPIVTFPPIYNAPQVCSKEAINATACCLATNVSNTTCCCCGDGLVNASFGESCDPALPSSIPSGWICSNSTCQLSNLPPVNPPNCGDGILQTDQGEQCDDGNKLPLDGCDQRCQLEFCPKLLVWLNVTYNSTLDGDNCSVVSGRSSFVQSPSNAPVYCFDLTSGSTAIYVYVNCITVPPILTIHTSSTCDNTPVFTQQVTQTCLNNPNSPYEIVFNNTRFAFGKDFLCTDTCGSSRRKRSITQNIGSEIIQLQQDQLFTPQKDDTLQQLPIEIVDAVINFFTNNTGTTEIKDKIVSFLTNFNTDPYLPWNETGLGYWLVFEFRCTVPINLDCTNGFGFIKTVEGVLIAIPIYIIVAYFVPPGVLSLINILIMMLFLMIFSALAWGYSFWCTPGLPECLGQEAVALGQLLNTSEIHWADGLIIGGNGTCNKEFFNCQDAGFIDGLDWLVLTLELNFPNQMSDFRNSKLFTFITMLPFINPTLSDTLAKWDLMGSDLSERDEACYKGLLLSGIAVTALLLMIGLSFITFFAIALGLLIINACTCCRALTYCCCVGCRYVVDDEEHDYDYLIAASLSKKQL